MLNFPIGKFHQEGLEFSTKSFYIEEPTSIRRKNVITDIGNQKILN